MTDRWTETATAIGRQILGRSQEEGDGLWWPRSVPPGAEGIVEERTPALWGGASGIGLFFIELYGVTRDPTMLDAALRALRWCVREVRCVPEHRRAGFLNGGIGVAYALCRAYDVTGDEALLERACEVSLDLVAEQEDWPMCDLLSGVAGTILVLAHVESRHPDPRLTGARERLTAALVGRSRPYREGLFWDASPRWALPLCGMAHGPSGVAFVLSQLLGPSELAPDHPLRALIREAFAFEDQYFSEAHGNWPDHRTAKSADAEPEFMNGWCHGAAGIGLARLGLADLGRDGREKDRAALALTVREIETTLGGETAPRSLTLCHGLGGLAELLLSVGGADNRSVAATVGGAALAQFETLGSIKPGYRSPDLDDSSLFVGSAGVGLFLLRLGHASSVPSVLRPTLPSGRLATPAADSVWDALEAGFFPRTRQLVASCGRGDSGASAGGPSVDDLLAGPLERTARTLGVGSPLLQAVHERIATRGRQLDAHDRERAEDLLALESVHAHALQKADDYVALSRGWRTPENREEAGHLPDATVLRVRPGVWVHRTRWDWTTHGEAPQPESAAPPDGLDLLIVVGVSGSTERPVSPLAARLLRRLGRPTPLDGVLAELHPDDRPSARDIVSAGFATGLLLQVRGRDI